MSKSKLTPEKAWERAPSLTQEIVDARARLAELYEERRECWRVLVDAGEQKAAVARAYGVHPMRIPQTLDRVS